MLQMTLKSSGKTITLDNKPGSQHCTHVGRIQHYVERTVRPPLSTGQTVSYCAPQHALSHNIIYPQSEGWGKRGESGNWQSCRYISEISTLAIVKRTNKIYSQWKPSSTPKQIEECARNSKALFKVTESWRENMLQSSCGWYCKNRRLLSWALHKI